MGRKEALCELEAMGYRVEANDNGVVLRIDDEELALGENPDWPSTIHRARDWLNELGEKAGAVGHRLRERRHTLGYIDTAAFCALTGLDESEVFEAEAGLVPPRAVHGRILDWLESGELRPRVTASA